MWVGLATFLWHVACSESLPEKASRRRSLIGVNRWG